MSLNLDSFLNEYNCDKTPLKQYFWLKKPKGSRLSMPIQGPYLDLMKVILGLHLIELEYPKRDIIKLIINTAFSDQFKSIKDRLQSLFFNLTGKRIELIFESGSPQLSVYRLNEQPTYRKIVLFSGGLDSLCGAIYTSKKHKVILAHCIRNQITFHNVLELYYSSSLKKTILFCYDARSRSTKGGSANTRGLLFLSFAYAIAASLGIRSILFCENGSQMLDVLLGSPVYPTKEATKNTNLNYINSIQEIFEDFDNEKFSIEMPFKEFTRAEIVIRFKKEIDFKKTYSCFTTRAKTKMCGICWNCFIRQMSLYALNIKEEKSLYEQNPFELVSEIERTKVYNERMSILFYLLSFYENVLNRDPNSLNEIKLNARNYFNNPIDLATRFAKDIFLGVYKSLQKIDQNRLNALGSKAIELLNKIDKDVLLEREYELLSSV